MLRLLFLLTVFGSLVTQIPGFIERGWDAPLKFLWLVTFACMMLFDTQSALDRRVRFLYLYLLPFLFFLYFLPEKISVAPGCISAEFTAHHLESAGCSHQGRCLKPDLLRPQSANL